MDVDNAVVVSNLTKCFGKLVAVDHVGFQVKKGELFGFLARARIFHLLEETSKTHF